MFAADLPPPVRFDGDSIVRARPRDSRELRTVLALTEDMWSHSIRNGEVDVRLSREALAALRRAGVPLEVLIEDVQGMIDAQAADRADRARRRAEQGGIAGEDWWADVKDLAAVEAKMDEWIAAHPALVTPIVVGTSLEQRPIRGVRISSQPPGAKVPAFLFNACQHAREWATPMTVMLLGQTLLDGAQDDAATMAILASCEIFIVPVANPDGYQYSWDAVRLWRKNRRDNGDGTFGVDLNRNWDFQWGGQGSSGNPNSETYRGPSPFSEPETQALRDFMAGHGRIVGHIDYHSYSQLILWPWGWTADLCDDQPLFAELGASMQDAIESSYGRVYTAGPILSTLYPAAGTSVDWSYGVEGIYSNTIEVRDTGSYGFLIPPEEVRPCAEENTAAAFAMMETLLAPAFLAPDPMLPSSVPAGRAVPVSIYASPLASTFESAPRLRARIGTSASFASVEMTPLGANRYGAMLPAAPCGSVVQFYFEWIGSPATATLPGGAPGEVFTASVSELAVVFSDAFESGSGWVSGAPGDTATAGLWVRVDPNGTTAQPEDDHTPAPGTMCWVTGQGPVGGAAGAADVDDGITSLTSPFLDGSDPDSVLRYWRWYSNNLGASPNQDSMLVLYSLDGSAWSQLEEVSESATAWVEASFRIGDFVNPPGPFKLRFVARDLGAGSLVEAAIDDLSIEAPSCVASTADLNLDGVVDGNDLGTLLGQWGACPGCSADFNGDGAVDGNDLGTLLGEWTVSP